MFRTVLSLLSLYVIISHVKTIVDIPADLLREAQMFAAKRRKRLKELINDALRQIVSKGSRSGSERSRKPDKPSKALRVERQAWLRDWERWASDIDRSRKSACSGVELLGKMRR